MKSPMKTPKFNFVPERQLRDIKSGNGYWTVTVMTSRNLYFQKEMVEILEMDGKFIQIFADTEKKAIGWRIIKDETTLDNIHNARKLNANKVSGAIIVSIGKIMEALNYKIDKTVRGLVVQTYTSPLVKESISYVVLPQVVVSKN